MPMTALTYSRYLDSAEEADSWEALEFDDEQYPQLPENVGNLRLHRRKAVLRQYVAAARRMYHFRTYFTFSLLTIIIQDSTSWMAVLRGSTSQKIRRSICQRSRNLIATTSSKNRPI